MKIIFKDKDMLLDFILNLYTMTLKEAGDSMWAGRCSVFMRAYIDALFIHSKDFNAPVTEELLFQSWGLKSVVTLRDATNHKNNAGIQCYIDNLPKFNNGKIHEEQHEYIKMGFYKVKAAFEILLNKKLEEKEDFDFTSYKIKKILNDF